MPTDDRLGASADRIDRELLVLAGVLLVGAMAALADTTMVSVALAALARDLEAGVATVQWVSAGYLLSMAVAIPTMGWLVDRFGSRHVWLGALGVFLGGSVLCGVAWSIESLIVFRVVKGLGAGLVLPLSQAILAQAAGPRRFGRVMALIGIPGQLAPILGPVVGGLILGSLGWRWIFLVNIPLIGAAIVLARRHLPASAERRATELDGVGLALAAPGLAAVLAGLSTAGRQAGFASPAVVVSLAVGGTLLAAFVVHARRAGGAALVDIRLFGVRGFRASAASMFLFGVSLYGPMLLLPLYYQQVRGATAVEVGWLLAPQGVGTMAALWLAGRAADRVGPRLVALTGIALATAATLPFCRVAVDTDAAALAAALVARGAGLGAAGVAVMSASYHGIARPAIPRATSLLNVIQRIGASFGTAVLAVVLQRGVDAGGRDDPAALAAAFGGAFSWTVALSLVALVPALALPARAADVAATVDDPVPSRDPPASRDQGGTVATTPSRL